MKRRDTIRDLYAAKPEAKLATANLPEESPPRTDRVLAGPVRTMGLALDKMEQENRAVHDALAKGMAVVEVEPGLIDGSFVRDRIEGDEAGFAEFRASIEARGQEVPILIRPHPESQGRYQVAYGHRRLRAVADLGRKVRAVVRPMTEAELVIAQGVENSARKDLTYIEKAVFAMRLEDRGFERPVIMDALSTDKGELSKLISVARDVPEHLVSAIGPAPKAGRRRWLAMAELLRRPAGVKAVAEVIAADGFTANDTDIRFALALAAASPKAKTPRPSAWRGQGGSARARITRDGETVLLAIDKEPRFGEFVAKKLDDLYQQFRSRADKPAGEGA